jgi:plastocyanin
MFRTAKSLFILAVAVSAFSIPAHAGSISGTVKFDGTAPKFKEIKMDADPVCVTHHTGPVYPQTLVLGDGNTMGNVFVYIKKGANKTTPAPTEELVIDQKGCEYTPHVAGIVAGQPVKVLNPDGTLHNVHALSRTNPEVNVAMPKFRKEISLKFDKPEFMIPLKCDVHPWMGAYLAVMPNNYFSVTKTDGKFSIADLPAGTYEVEAWHEKLGTKTATVTLKDGDNATTDFAFAAPSKK